MARFRDKKQELQRICAGADWKEALEELISSEAAALEAVNPLLALLPRPELSWQAAFGLGRALSFIADNNMEAARVFMRRLMWSMNEESGNLGWGIPEAMGCILAASPALAGEYSRIFISYGRDTGHEDNYVEHAPLRRGVYWGIGRLASANPAAALPALPHLTLALEDEDAGIRGMAAFAIRQLADNAPKSGETAEESEEYWKAAGLTLERAEALAGTTEAAGTAVELFNGRDIVTLSLGSLLARAREGVEKRRERRGIF